MDASRESRRRDWLVAWIRDIAWQASLALIAIVSGGLSAALSAQPAASAPSAGEESTEAGLALANLDLLDSRDGYAIPPDTHFLPGETVHLFFQVKGYRVGVEDRVRLQYKVEALDPQGRRFHIANGGEVDVELAPQDENWMPVVRYSPRIPDHAGGGTYSMHILVRDLLAGDAIETAIPIEVDGTRLHAADQLAVRNFHFSKDEDGARLAEPVFDPGEEVWAAFFITGYATRGDNSYDVESDAAVVDAEGERMFAFESRGEEGSPFYPRLWLPAKLRLDLEEDIPPGSYTVVLRVRDGVGGSEETQQYGFRIR